MDTLLLRWPSQRSPHFQHPAPGSDSMRFSYSNGSTPLDGFTIEQGIGAGGFGEVYCAVNSAGKRVALKKVIRNLDIELRGVRQCINLKHINLISLWDIKTDRYGESWVVMEYVPGPSLRDLITAHPAGLPEDEIKRWFVSTAAGVAYLHQQEIVHRDLKPANIFYDEDTHVVKIGDYGLSKFMSTSRRSGQTESVGTFHYMAPEIGRGVYGREIDIYALGIILFEVLTGDVPFDGESTQEIIMKHLTDDPRLDRVPAGFRKVISTALQKDPELRYHTVPEMLIDIPWPDVAGNSQRIVSMQSVGSLVISSPLHPNEVTPFRGPQDVEASPNGTLSTDPNQGFKTNPLTLSQSRLADTYAGDEIIRAEDVEIVAKDEGAEIVFGPLNERSQDEATPHIPSEWRSRSSVSGTGASLHASTLSANQSTSGIPEDDVQHESVNPSSRDIAYMNGGAGTSSSSSVSRSHSPPGSRISSADIEFSPVSAKSPSVWMGIMDWWTNAHFSTPVKVLLLAAGCIVLVTNSAWLLPLAAVLGLIYLTYYTIHSWWAGAVDSSSQKARRRELKQQAIEEKRRQLQQRPVNSRVLELSVSVFIAALACAVLNLLGLALSGATVFNASSEAWRMYGWMTLTSILGCWGLLLASKFWENRPDEPTTRRLTMMGCGVIIGLWTYYLAADVFSINLDALTVATSPEDSGSSLVVQGIPFLPAYLIYFAGLFGVLRWWKNVDPVRWTRLSIVSVSFCLVWSCLFSHMLELPVAPNAVIAVAMCVAIQLSAPWWPIGD